MNAFNACFDPEFLRSCIDLLAAFGGGVLLAVAAWIVGFLVFALLRMLKP